MGLQQDEDRRAGATPDGPGIVLPVSRQMVDEGRRQVLEAQRHVRRGQALLRDAERIMAEASGAGLRRPA